LLIRFVDRKEAMLGVMKAAGWLALLITLGRFAGKFLGSRLGAQVSHAPQVVKKYLDLRFYPQRESLWAWSWKPRKYLVLPRSQK